MPLDKQVFRTRAITAIVFAAIVLAGIFINGYTFLSLLVIIGIGAYSELLRIFRKTYSRLSAGPFVAGAAYVFLPLLLLADLSFNTEYRNGNVDAFSYQKLVPLFIIGCIWINDTMAYLTGSWFGKTPLSPVSPKKTREGTLGGIICTVIIAKIVTKSTGLFSTPALDDIADTSFLIAFTGTLGDLFESKLKRRAGVKDSAAFMPGHGGFLDRFDSLLFAVPAVWIYWKISAALYAA